MDAKADPHTVQERGFILEDRSSGQPMYYDCSNRSPGSTSWSDSRKLALRFARKIDGERFMETFRLTYATVIVYVE